MRVHDLAGRARCATLVLVISALPGRVHAQALPAAGREATVVIIVRHAEKDSVPLGDPSLTERGRARAAALVGAVSLAHVQAIVTTQFRRTRETAAPLAAALHVVPEIVVRALPIEAHARAVAEAVHRHDGQTVLVVGHAETVSAIMAALGAPRLSDLCASDYSELFVLVLAGSTTRLIRGSYGAPSASPADCSNPP